MQNGQWTAPQRSEAAEKLRNFADYVESLEREGWQLTEPVMTITEKFGSAPKESGAMPIKIVGDKAPIRSTEMIDAAYVRTINGQQRKFLKIDGHEYPAEEVAWLYVTGEWPKHRIIFKDGNPLNLKWDNLIDAA